MRYAISGVWKNAAGTITHYAFHTVTENSFGKATKITKAIAVQRVDNPNNTATTVVWNYTTESWNWGEEVHVVGTSPMRYLRSNHDNSVRDNLDHLINYGWICNDFI